MRWAILLAISLILVGLAACDGGGPNDDDKSAEPMFVGSLRIMADECFGDGSESKCRSSSKYVATICAGAKIGIEVKEYGLIWHLSDIWIPFCDRLEIIANEPRFEAIPHMIELAQDVENSIGH